MKILHVTKYFYPAISFGGPIQCTYNLTRQLVRRGHNVTVYASDVLGFTSHARIPYNTRTIDGVKIHYFSNMAKLADMYITPGIMRAFNETLDEFDVIHLHEYRSFQNIAFLMCNNSKTRYVLQTHGMKFGSSASREGKPFHNATRRFYDQIFGKGLIDGASKIIALTTSEKSLIETGGGDKERIIIIPNGVSPEDFRSIDANFKTKFELGKNKIILYVGRINKSKGLDALARAFSLLRGKHGDIRLVVIGPDDGYLSGLKELVKGLHIENMVIFTGVLDHEQLASAYSAARVVVYPGTHEGFPIVPLEAGLLSKPLVVSNDPGMSYVHDGGFGLTFEYGNVLELAQKLDLLLSDDGLARRMGRAGRERVLENYTWDIVAGKVEELYRDVLA